MERRDVVSLLSLALGTFGAAGPMLASAALAKSQGRALLPGEAKALVKSLGDAAVAMLSDKGLSRSEKIRRFRHLLNQSFAMKGIARFALGRYWRRASFPQRRRYLKLFEDYIVNSYAARFGNYSGEIFVIEDEKIDDRGWATVSTRIQRPGGEPVKVNWHLRVVEGISMSLTQRSDFAATIHTAGGDIDAFLDILEAKVRNVKQAAS